MTKNHLLFSAFFGLILTFSLSSCNKEKETVIKGNVIPAYSQVPEVEIENYVNRLFIDLIGREPVEAELKLYVDYLKTNNLSGAARDSLVRFLQTDDELRIIDAVNGKEYTDSYRFAYVTWLYEKVKSRFFIELGKDEDFYAEINRTIEKSPAEDTLDPKFSGADRIKIRKLYKVVNARFEYLEGNIGMSDMSEAMINNANYDEINMQNINWVRAVFNDLMYRIIYSELNNRYAQSLNSNSVDYLFGIPFSNKDEFAYIMTHSWEFYDGLATWLYLTYLQREPSSEEAFQVIEALHQNDNITSFQDIQRKLLITDEYARFKFVNA